MRELKLEKCPCGAEVCKEYFLNISQDGRFSKEDAEFIVRACNSHDELLETLKEAVSGFWGATGDSANKASFRDIYKDHWINDAERIIKKVEVTP